MAPCDVLIAASETGGHQICLTLSGAQWKDIKEKFRLLDVEYPRDLDTTEELLNQTPCQFAVECIVDELKSIGFR